MKNKIIIPLGMIACSLLGFDFFSNTVYAATIFTDDFNSYTNGDLHNQGDWDIYAGNSFAVEDSVVFEGTKAIKSKEGINFSSNVKRKGVLTSDGMITFYLRTNINGIGRAELRESSTNKIGSSIQYGGPESFWAGKIVYWNGIDEYLELGPMEKDVWYAVQMQWRSSDKKVRYNINGGTWTDFVPSLETWSSGLDTIVLGANVGAGRVTYFDAIGEDLVENKKTPVLIVPGVTGTELKNGSELLWADLDRMSADLDDGFLDELSFNSTLQPNNPSLSAPNIIGFETLFGARVFDYTDGLITELKNQGYTENQSLFTFPYDWRYGVTGKYDNGETNTDLLQQKIVDILQQTGADKVDIIAHSMGGLIAKEYVANNPANHHIGKAVFVGVPSTGSPASIKTLLQGNNLGMLFVSPLEIKKIAENMPAIYDLLPSQQYYDIKGSFVKVIDEGEFLNVFDTTQKDLNYQEFKNFITTDHNLNSQALTNAENLHTENFDNFDLRTTGVDLYAIDGCKAGTLANITENRFKNIFGQSSMQYKNPKFLPGDGTVPLESATNLPIDQDKKYYALTNLNNPLTGEDLIGVHGHLLSNEGTRQQIVNIISDNSLQVKENIITQDINRCKLNGKAISVFSPVDINVNDQDGNISGLASDQSIINNIPNAAFEIFGDHKFLYLPTDDGQTYDVKIQGTGTGTYTIHSQNIANSQVTEDEVFSNLPVTPELSGQINLGDQTTLVVKQTDTSEPETIFPSSVINGDQAEDVVPPVSVATASGTLGEPGFYRSNVKVLIEAQDQVVDGYQSQTSGVLSVEYSVDGAKYQTVVGSVAELVVSGEGDHDIAFFAIDKAGNKEQEQITHVVIDTVAPEALIQFDPVLMDLTFSKADEDEGVVVTDQDNMITLTDEAGNVTKITLKNRQRKIVMAAEILSITYNGVAANINKNAMAYLWLVDKNKKIKKLSQYVKSKNDYHILAIFDGKNTKLLGKDASGKISKSLPGLKIIKIKTNKGDLTWSY